MFWGFSLKGFVCFIFCRSGLLLLINFTSESHKRRTFPSFYESIPTHPSVRTTNLSHQCVPRSFVFGLWEIIYSCLNIDFCFSSNTELLTLDLFSRLNWKPVNVTCRKQSDARDVGCAFRFYSYSIENDSCLTMYSACIDNSPSFLFFNKKLFPAASQMCLF